MTTEHDFQKALDTLPMEIRLNGIGQPSTDLKCRDVEAVDVLLSIRFALRLADKLLKKEVSVAMLKAGQGYFDQQRDHSGFSAMIEQAVKEIENEIQK